MIFARPVSSSPKEARNSFFSSSDSSCATSDSISAEMITAPAPSAAALVITISENLLPAAAESSSTLQTYKTGLAVSSCSILYSLQASFSVGAGAAVRAGFPAFSASMTGRMTASRTTYSFSPVLAFFCTWS